MVYSEQRFGDFPQGGGGLHLGLHNGPRLNSRSSVHPRVKLPHLPSIAVKYLLDPEQMSSSKVEEPRQSNELGHPFPCWFVNLPEEAFTVLRKVWLSFKPARILANDYILQHEFSMLRGARDRTGVQ